MFNAGDTIVHTRYGAGEVIGTRALEQDGETIRYFCVELADDRGTLMIRQDQLCEDDMRPAIDDTELIHTVLHKAPQELSDNHRSRQSKIEKKLKSGNPRKIAQALRDLTWREETGKLTGTDSRLRSEALKLLINELALSSERNVQEVRDRLTSMINQAIASHMARAEAS